MTQSDRNGTKPRLSAEQRRHWDAEGHVLLPSFFDGSQIDLMARWVDEIARWPVVEGKYLNYYELVGDKKVLSRTENFLPYHDQFRRFLEECGIYDVMAEIIGEPVVLFKEKIHYKSPGTGDYPAHQDGHSHASSPYAVQLYHRMVMIFLDAADEKNGCLVLGSGHEKSTLLAKDASGALKPEVVSALQWAPCPCPPGSAFLFDTYLPHFSATNKSDAARRTIFLTFNGVSKGDLREAHIRDRATPKPNSREIKPNLVPQTRLKD